MSASIEERILCDNEEAFETGYRYECQGFAHETENAFLFTTKDNEDVWLPKSQILLWKRPDGNYELFVKRWLAQKTSKQLAKLL